MSHENVLTRREFTVQSALAMLAGVTITISGCGDDATPAPSPTPTDKTGTVSTDAGHTHTGAVITAAQLTVEMHFIDLRAQAHIHTRYPCLADSRKSARDMCKDVVTDSAHSHTDVQLGRASQDQAHSGACERIDASRCRTERVESQRRELPAFAGCGDVCPAASSGTAESAARAADLRRTRIRSGFDRFGPRPGNC